jgi:RNA polymerase sigma-70 factor (ECF subfamily)
MTQEQKFAAAYDSYFRHVYAYCRRRTDLDRVDDAVADTFLTAWRRIDAMPDGDSALPWLYGVAFKVISHQWRSSNRKQKLERKLVAIGAPLQEAADHLVVHRDEIAQLMLAVAKLSDPDVEVLRLALWEDLSTGAMGEALGIPANTAKQRYHRARNRLIKEFERVQPTAARRGGTA